MIHLKGVVEVLNVELTHELWTQRTNSACPIATTTWVCFSFAQGWERLLISSHQATISALRKCCSTFAVLEWQVVTVASIDKSIWAIGIPLRFDLKTAIPVSIFFRSSLLTYRHDPNGISLKSHLPKTVAVFPATVTPLRCSSSTHPAGVHGTSAGRDKPPGPFEMATVFSVEMQPMVDHLLWGKDYQPGKKTWLSIKTTSTYK